MRTSDHIKQSTCEINPQAQDKLLCNLPLTSTCLRQAGVLPTEQQIQTRGSMSLCSSPEQLKFKQFTDLIL